MRITKTEYYYGPNIYSHNSVIKRSLALDEYEGKESVLSDKEITDFLYDCMPGLKEHYCSFDMSGLFTKAISKNAGISIAHIISHISVELQRIGGLPIQQECISEREHLLYVFQDQDVGVKAGNLATAIVRQMFGLRGIGSDTKAIINEIKQKIDGFSKFTVRHTYIHPDNIVLIRGVLKRGIPWYPLNAGFIVLGQGKYQKRIKCGVSSETRQIGSLLAKQKDLTIDALSALGLPTPNQQIVRTATGAIQAADRIGYPVVVKPSNSSYGRGVTTQITHDDEVKRAFELANNISSTVAVERYIDGEEHRMFVVNGELVAVGLRERPYIIGDGVNTIHHLIDELNSDPRRVRDFLDYSESDKRKQKNRMFCVEIEEQLEYLMKRAGYNLDTVMEKGEKFYLRSTSNFSQGGSVIDVTDIVHEDNRRLAVRAAECIGLDIAGVDFIITDISRSYRDIGGAIIELNSSPGLRLHYEPTEGRERDVAGPILDMVCPPGAQYEIPIVYISGLRGKKQTAHILSHILTLAGHTVGIASEGNIHIAGNLVSGAPVTAHDASRMLIREPSVDAVIQVTTPREIYQSGTGYEYCNVGAVLNISIDGPRSSNKQERMKSATSKVLQSAQDMAIVNIDDSASVDLVLSVSPERLCIISEDPKNSILQQHIRSGYVAVTLVEGTDGKQIALYEHNRIKQRISLNRIPVIKGKNHKTRTTACLFAMAMAYGIGKSNRDNREGLRLLNDYCLENQENIIVNSTLPYRVVIGNGRDPEQSSRLIALTKRLKALTKRLKRKNCRIIVLSGIGKKSEEWLTENSSVLSKSSDVFICRNNRQRDLLRKIGISSKRIERFKSENDAVQRALDYADKDDIVLILAKNMRSTQAAISKITKVTSNESWKPKNVIQGSRELEANDSQIVNTSHYNPTIKEDLNVRYVRFLDKFELMRTFSKKAVVNSIGKLPPLWSAAELANATNGEWISGDVEDLVVNDICYFRRDIFPGDLFVTTNPEQWGSGYKYTYQDIATLKERGAVAAIVAERPNEIPEGFPVLLVKHSQNAINNLARAARDRFKGKVICLTGSVGKTTTKTGLIHVLRKQSPTWGSRRNFNGVPGFSLSVAQTPRDFDYAVFEFGVSAPGINLPRAQISRPHVAIITELQPDHLQYYNAIEEYADQKAILFDGLEPDGTVILNRDMSLYERFRTAAEKRSISRIVTFGSHPESDVQLLDCSLSLGGSEVRAQVHGELVSYTIPLPGRHNVINSLGMLAGVDAVGADWKQAAADLASLPTLTNRIQQQIVNVIDGTIGLIDDTFSANPASMRAAFEVLQLTEPGKNGRRVVVLGEMKELGKDSPQLHAGLAESVINTGIDKVFTLGDDMKHLFDALPDDKKGAHGQSLKDVLKDTVDYIRSGDILLFKNSNRTKSEKLEDIIDALNPVSSSQTKK